MLYMIYYLVNKHVALKKSVTGHSKVKAADENTAWLSHPCNDVYTYIYRKILHVV